MRHLFLPDSDLSAETVRVEGADHHHLVHVLRLRMGERLIALDNRGGAVYAEIADLEKRAVTLRTGGQAKVAPEPPVSITVAQALGKGDKFEQVIQHATEAGASAFLPLLTERAVVRLTVQDGEAKRLRWSLIAKAAAEQAGRPRIPVVAAPLSLTELTTRFADYAVVLLLHPQGETLADALCGCSAYPSGHIGCPSGKPDVSAKRVEEPQKEEKAVPHLFTSSPLHPFIPSSALLLVGPEGGFASAEIEKAQAAGARVVSLGPYILRTETAALVAVSQILYHRSSSKT